MAIGVAAKCKINSNIGNSSAASKHRPGVGEIAHLRPLRRGHGDWISSTGGDIHEIREAILRASPVPIGTVPIYEALARVTKVRDLTAEIMLEVIEEQAAQGV